MTNKETRDHYIGSVHGISVWTTRFIQDNHEDQENHVELVAGGHYDEGAYWEYKISLDVNRMVKLQEFIDEAIKKIAARK